MQDLIEWGRRETKRYSNQNIQGFLLTARIQHATLNNAFDTNDMPVDWSEILIKVNYKGADGQNVTYSVPADLWGCMSSYYNHLWDDAFQYNNDGKSVRVTQTAGLDNIVDVKLPLLWPEPMNLDDDDVLELELNVQSAGLHEDGSESESFILIDPIPAIGFGYGIPVVEYTTIQASRSNESFSLGNNIDKVYFHNRDKTGLTSADRVLNYAGVKSNKVNDTLYAEQLFGARDLQIITATESDERGQCHMIIDADDLDGVVIDLNFNSANVTADKNFLVCCKREMGAVKIARTLAREGKIKKRNQAKFQGIVASASR